MTPQDLDFVAGLVRERSGIVITPDKAYLVESRLNPIARRNGFSDISSLIAELRNSRGQRLHESVVEAMTTNETFFFRDKTPFQLMEEVVYPYLIEKRGANAKVRLWAAACSTGQEPFSLAMQVKELKPKLQGLQVEIVATDIANSVLDRARSGVFTQFEVQRGLPINYLVKYFNKEDDSWRISKDILSMVKFERVNLLDDFSHLGKFDVIFLRNVLIYFSMDTKKDILDRVAARCASDGILILGAAETTLGITETFLPLRESRGLYRRNPNAPAKGR